MPVRESEDIKSAGFDLTKNGNGPFTQQQDEKVKSD